VSDPILFVDVARAGKSDADAVAKILSIDIYKSRLLLNARVPFVAQGFPSHGFATKAVWALAAIGIPASAHTAEDLRRVPAGIAASAVTRRATAYLFTTSPGVQQEVPFDSLRALVHAKLTVRLADAEPSFGRNLPTLRRPGIGGLGGMIAPIAPTPREPIHYWRLDVFAEPRTGECVRLCVRHDLFDFACLLERKTLSAVRNLTAFRDEVSQARAKNDVPIDDWFERTELARSAFADDAWSDVDLRSGSARSQLARSNRAAFEAFAATRFLHERTRVPERSDHYFEL